MSIFPDSFQKFLQDISKRGMHRGLDRMQKALEILGHPEQNYPAIHIAGTNGKGSTCQYVAQILSQAGHRVGLTLSPHIDDYRERIQVSCELNKKLQLISVSDLMRVHERMLRKIPQELELTYFEWSLLLALECFREQRVDVAVLETGMGGRWDATNLCRSVVTGITTVSLDHTEILGSTTQEILAEKLEIIKQGNLFLFGPQEEDLVCRARLHCEKKGAAFVLFQPSSAELAPAEYNWEFAVQICRLMREKNFSVDEALLQNRKDYQLPPARCEVVSENPKIVVDGAHNEASIVALSQYMRQNFGENYHLVFGCLSDRSFLSLAKVVQSQNENFWLRFDAGERTTSEEMYQEAARLFGGVVVNLDDDFFQHLMKLDKPIVVCGSFYLCSQFKRWFFEHRFTRAIF